MPRNSDLTWCCCSQVMHAVTLTSLGFLVVFLFMRLLVFEFQEWSLQYDPIENENSRALDGPAFNITDFNMKLRQSELDFYKGPNFLVPENQDPVLRFLRFPEIETRPSFFWNYFKPRFTCPLEVERVGRSEDGGMSVCGVWEMRQIKKCVVYSFGIGDSVSFERSLLQRTSCTVLMFDYIGTRIQLNPIHLVEAFRGRAEYFLEDLGTSIKALLRKNGNTFVDILKLNLQGGEWLALTQAIKDFPEGLPFGQLLLKIRMDQVKPNQQYLELRRLFHYLENSGLRAYHRDRDPDQHGPYTYQYSFLSIRFGMFANEGFLA